VDWSPAESAARRQRHTILLQALAVLTLPQLEVIWLRFVWEVPARELARHLEISERAVFALQKRALDRLRAELARRRVHKMSDL